jgi:uncharacterized protein (TIGR00725 family)
MARRPQITVIGNAQASEDALRLAEQAGEALGCLGTIISGGRGGIMEAVSRGAKRAGSLVIGILPGDTPDDGNPYLDVVLPTGIGFARNMPNVLAGDVVVAIGGAAGTLNEISFAWMHNKPIVALVGAGGWSDRLAGHAIDDRRTDVIVRAESIDELERVVREILSRT